MARIDWESKLKSWRRPLSDAEEERCERTRNDIEHEGLDGKVFNARQ